ncbi:MAG TPA: hypothetical protein VK097_03030 [Lentibacillus sp.]|uniref:hypothetical protein n=1 Tax=Lentibacillus sp. TaxID=1925746 RepID=UPI002B4AC24F|nr:hypothetical protein [Lentibacillus sp.]HLR61394.1 hypothetical protein [Lentibacillus sp.]
MMINEGRYGSEQILDPDTVGLLVENQLPEFPGDEHGLGWEVAQSWYMGPLSDTSAIGHTGASLTFETWYRLENNYDFGAVEVSEDGENWTSINKEFTGISEGWESHSIEIPEDINYIRFS